ncbi:MAG: outer membrane beta-barrel protein [Chlorobi bacterium]|nr:outer membrane beta-barrel protein [Chlorobiota bacterium]
MQTPLRLALLLLVLAATLRQQGTAQPLPTAPSQLPPSVALPFPVPFDRILNPDTRGILIGPYGGGNFNMHNGQFVLTENNIVCCTFDEGSGIGPVFGAKAMIPLGEQLSLSPRIAYESRAGDFETTSDPVPIFGQNNQVENVIFTDRLEANLATFNMDLLGTYTLTDFGLYLALGPSAGIVMGKDFTKTETITTPDGVVYQNGTGTEQQLFTGELDIVNTLQFELRGGLGAIIGITDAISLNPEVLYGFPFTKISKEDDWKTSPIQFTIGLLFAL